MKASLYEAPGKKLSVKQQYIHICSTTKCSPLVVFVVFFPFALQIINLFSKCKLLTFNLNAGRWEATVLEQYKKYTRRSLH